MNRLFTLIIVACVFMFASCDMPKYQSGNVSDIGSKHKVEMLIFSAKWCSACKRVPPSISEIRSDFPKVTFREIDIDASENASLVKQFQVSSIPHFELTVDDRSVGTFKGARSSTFIAEFIRANAKEE